MQGRNFFILLTFACFLLCSSEATAQKLTTNEDGEKIIVYPDGSWRYFDSEDEEDVKEVAAALEEEKDKKKKVKKKKKSKKKKSKKSKTAKSKKKKSKKSKGKKTAKKKKKKGKTPADALAEDAAKQVAVRRADAAAGREEEARLDLEDKVFKRIFLEEELAEAFQNVDMTHEDVAEIETELNKAKAEEKASRSVLKSASSYAKKMEKMIDMPKAKRDKQLAKLDGGKSKKDKKKNAVVDRSEANQDTDLDETYTLPSSGKRSLKKYNSKEDVMLNPPSKDCNLTFDGVDEFTGNRRRDVEKQLFFTYTPERFRPYFKGRNYITCYGFLSKVSDGVTMLNLEFVILTEQASREFGVLEMGSQMTIRGIDGKRTILQNKKTATGIANSLDKTTIYKAQYHISSGQVRTLKKTEVDKIRVIWGTGYEDYEVYEVDFLIDQFKCL